MLRSVSSNLNVVLPVQYVNFLKQRAYLFKPQELLVNVLLDESHIKSCLSHQSGQLFGGADNQKVKVATRIQAIMMTSIISKNKDVVSLVPVGKMTYLSNLLFNAAQYAYLRLLSAYHQWNIQFWKWHTRNKKKFRSY